MQRIIQSLIKLVFILAIYGYCLPVLAADSGSKPATAAAAAAGKSTFTPKPYAKALYHSSTQKKSKQLSAYLVLYSDVDETFSVFTAKKIETVDSNPDQWVFPGGGVDKSGSSRNDPRATAFKEFHEETGVDLLKDYTNQITEKATVPFSVNAKPNQGRPAYYCTFVETDMKSLAAIQKASTTFLASDGNGSELAQVKIDTLVNAQAIFLNEHDAKEKLKTNAQTGSLVSQTIYT